MAVAVSSRSRNYTSGVQKRAGTGALYNKSKAAGVVIDTSDSSLLKYNQAGTTRTLVSVDGVQTLTNKTITGSTGAGAAEIVAATNVIAASESGTTFFLNSATEFVSTLPTPALGLNFRFIVSAAPSGASYTVIAAAAATILKGHVLTSQDAGGSSDSGTSGELTLTFVDGKAVAGDWADFISDGTNWFVQAGSKVFDAITIS